jgi:hypothetical protein
METIAIAGVFALAGMVKGITGMGLPTVGVTLLGLWMAPEAAAALLVMPGLATNVAQCRGPYLKSLVQRFWPLWCALVAATVWMPQLPGAWPLGAHSILGGVLLAYGTWGLWRPQLPDLASRASWLGPFAGAASGVLTALTAVTVVPLVPYLQALKLEKDEMVQALGLTFGIGMLAIAVRLHATGQPLILTPQGVLALLAAFAGQQLGNRLRARMSVVTFQRGLLLTFVFMGAVNLLRGG